MTSLPDLKNWQKEFDKKFGDFGHVNDKFEGVPMPEEVKDFISSLLKSQQEQRDGEIVKMLWEIHEDEKNSEEMESYNRALDLAIFRIQNPDLSSLKGKQGMKKEMRFKGTHLSGFDVVQYLIGKWIWIPKWEKHDFVVIKVNGKWKIKKEPKKWYQFWK